MKKVDAQLWGGRYDGTRGQVVLEAGRPTDVIEWPDNLDPPRGILGENLDAMLDDIPLLRYLLDLDYNGRDLLYRLEKCDVRTETP